jgi:hypothetical protein
MRLPKSQSNFLFNKVLQLLARVVSLYIQITCKVNKVIGVLPDGPRTPITA